MHIRRAAAPIRSAKGLDLVVKVAIARYATPFGVSSAARWHLAHWVGATSASSGSTRKRSTA